MTKKDGCPTGEKKIHGECWKQIGVIGVDSGQILIVDPAYLDTEWKKEDFPENAKNGKLPKSKNKMSYYACCRKTLLSLSEGQLTYENGLPGLGVVSCTGFGDGEYPVYAQITDYGKLGKRVSKLLIDFISEK